MNDRVTEAPVTVGEDAGDERWMTAETHDLARAIASLDGEAEALRFLRDLCTVNELRELGQRWHVARLLADGVSYHEIREQTGASSATISRVNQWLRYGRDGYRRALERAGSGPERPAVERPGARRAGAVRP